MYVAALNQYPSFYHQRSLSSRVWLVGYTFSTFTIYILLLPVAFKIVISYHWYMYMLSHPNVYNTSARLWNLDEAISRFSGCTFSPKRKRENVKTKMLSEFLLRFCIRLRYKTVYDNEWLIDCCLTPTLAVFQLYRAVYKIMISVF
jgi:hypothetical protein